MASKIYLKGFFDNGHTRYSKSDSSKGVLSALVQNVDCLISNGPGILSVNDIQPETER